MPSARLMLAACLVLAGSIADAAPAKRVGHHGKARKQARHRHDNDDHETARGAHHRKAVRSARRHEEVDDDRDAHDRVALVDDAEDDRQRDDRDDGEPEAPVKLRRHATSRGHDWHLAIGPNVWASSVEATVSVGSKTVSAGVDFLQLERHARYGIPLLVDAHVGRLSMMADVMYGVIDINGAKEVGPLMVNLAGSASSLMIDGVAGFRLVGDDRSPWSLEGRGGVRYQRTAITASLDLDGAPLASYASVTGGLDVVAGARVVVRPCRWFDVAGTADVGLVGSSTTTWSAAADARARITSHVLVSLGWRTLTLDSASIELSMHGPRAAIQVLF